MPTKFEESLNFCDRKFAIDIKVTKKILSAVFVAEEWRILLFSFIPVTWFKLNGGGSGSDGGARQIVENHEKFDIYGTGWRNNLTNIVTYRQDTTGTPGHCAAMAPYIRYGENDTNGRKRHYPAKFGGKQRKLTRWQQKHRIITVPSTMNNYTDIHYIYDIDDPLSNITNGTATMLNNHFYRKKLLLGDMSARRSVGAQPLTTVIVIASIFLFITMSITAATVVFCKKKNTVFVLNKSEQDDNDYDLELEEMENTDVDFVEFNEDVDLSALEQQPATSSRRFCDDRASCKYEQDGYRRMVVSAVVEHETPRKSRGLYNNSSTTDSDLSLNGTSHGILNSKHPSAKDYRVDLEQMDSSRSHKLPGENPENVKELLRRLPLGAQTIQYINGKRYLVCELPERLANPTTDTKAVDTDLYGLQSEIDIQPDMSSIQGEISPQRRIDDTGFQDCDNELICDGLNDPYLSLGMSHSQSMGVLTNQPHDRNLRMSMSTDFKGGQESWKQ